MQESSDMLPAGDSASIHTSPGKTQAESPDADWSFAEQRILLYLRALRIPEQKRLELAREVLRRTQQTSAATSSLCPAAAAMRELRKLIREQKLSAGELFPPGPQPGHEGVEYPGAISSMPPLNRGFMFPIEIDRNPWSTFLKKRVLRIK